nr:unnamed protein product [Callosobruchus chinensis]
MRVFWSQVVLITLCGVVVSATIIVIEDAKACFRRVLAAKRVSRAFVKRAVTCETVEECQRECASEKRFVCEGFNYRLDPTGRGKGDCELLDCPLSRLDLRRDILPDPNYDYYERDRNAVECEGRRPQNRYGGSGGYSGYGGYGVKSGSSYGGSYGSSWNYNSYSGGDYHRYYEGNRGGGSYYPDRRYDYEDDRRGSGDRWSSDRPRRPYLPPSDRPSYYGGGSSSRRGDHTNYPAHDRTIPEHLPTHYLPPPTKPQYGDTDRILFEHEGKTHYLPPKLDTSSDWGLYGKTNQAYNQYGGYNYWYSKYNNEWKPIGNYIPEKPQDDTRPSHGGTHLVPSGPDGTFDNHITPSRHPHRYDYKRDECSLRMASGFKLHKTVVGRLFSVQNIYECEYLCFKEKGFLCSSYAYRYTLPADNCYLSPKDYKELNYYTDLEPDRDFDIYTMNNRDKCAASIGVRGGDNSECFLRVRSGKRLDGGVVKDSLTTKSAVECQIECLKATRFTCRAFSFRYGPPVIGGVIDNCQLTDCPFYELDPRHHFVPEAGFEIYERASFGHGCEPDHFVILAHGNGNKNKVAKVDQLCYVGFGTPARLLPQAVRKAVYVPSELECKQECSKFRHGTLLQCMSFSFRPGGSKFTPNCHLSDILQRDLLQDIDYVYDPVWKLFAWDNFSPDCVAIIYETGDTDNYLGHGGDMDHKHDTSHYGLDTWRVYSVSGWPCRRGSSCIENTEAGFWYCELEGANNNGWDYCCRPDHQCGASYEFPYQWCYVGPARTQWRKCSDSYYPYIRHLIDERVDHHKPYYPPDDEIGRPPEGLYPPPPYRPGARPDRPPAPPLAPQPTPSLNQYEQQFDDEFLSLKPPKLPAGLSQSRHWPISYLHKEMPPNTTDNESQLTKDSPKYLAIQNLINVIKNNDLQNLEYHISNESKSDDILFVRIPLPANFTRDAKNSIKSNTSADLASSESKRSQKSLFPPIDEEEEEERSTEFASRWGRNSRRGFVTRTNVTSHGRRS